MRPAALERGTHGQFHQVFVGQAHVYQQNEVYQVFYPRVDRLLTWEGIGVYLLGEVLLDRQGGYSSGQNTGKVQGVVSYEPLWVGNQRVTQGDVNMEAGER